MRVTGIRGRTRPRQSHIGVQPVGMLERRIEDQGPARGRVFEPEPPPAAPIVGGIARGEGRGGTVSALRLHLRDLVRRLGERARRGKAERGSWRRLLGVGSSADEPLGEGPTTLFTPSSLEALAERAGVDPEILNDLKASPRGVALLMDRIRAELPPPARAAADEELLGRRFIDHEHYQAAVVCNETAHHRYSKSSFEAWTQAEALMMGAAHDGQPLTADLLARAHAAACAPFLAKHRLGVLRSSAVRQGGTNGEAYRIVTQEEIRVLRGNPDLSLVEFGPDKLDRHRVFVHYASPKVVRVRLQAALENIESRLAGGEDPVEIAADAQRTVVSIHPYVDGNGRISRLVMDFVLARAGLPPPILRDTQLDTVLSAGDWRKEVRAGLERSCQVMLDHWAAQVASNS